MDAHARSLLERLNISTSPKVSKSSTSETMTIATPVPPDVLASEAPGQVSPISPQAQRTIHATLEEPEATMSVKDLLVSARHRSREASLAPSTTSTDKINPRGAHSPETAALHPPAFPNPSPARNDLHITVNTSDYYSSVNQEEMPTTPGGSNNSSLGSNCTGSSHSMAKTRRLSQFQGIRIANDFPCCVTLPPMETDIPRLQITTDSSGRSFPGEGVEQIANLTRTFGTYDREIIGATTKYIVYALKDGRIRIIDQNTGTRAIAETPSSSPVISLNIQDGFDSEESFLLALDLAHELTVWSIKPWNVDSADVPLDYLVCLQTTDQNIDQSFPPIAKWWPRYSNCLAVYSELAIRIYVLAEANSGQHLDISGGKEHAISIPVDIGVKDFSFSADGSALAVVDYHGDILLWALCSEPTFREFYNNSHLNTKLTLSKPTITFTLPPDSDPCSIQFLDLMDQDSNTSFTPLLLVGSNYNRRLYLIDMGRGILLQEITLVSISSEATPIQNFSMTFTKERQFLTLGDTVSNSIFFFHLFTPPFNEDQAASQSEYIVYTAERDLPGGNPEEFAAFDFVTELPFFPHHHLQTLAVTTSMDAYLDVFTAHSKGFTMLLPNMEDIFPADYLQAESINVKPIQNPKLRKAIQGVISRNTPSPQSLSRRSSIEGNRNIREKSPPLVAKEPINNTKENVTIDGYKSFVNNTSDSTNSSLGTPAKEVPSDSPLCEKSRSPSPTEQVRISREKEAASTTNALEAFFTQALEQQYQRLVSEQKRLTGIADDRHESILRVVSSTLTTNVGKLLEQTVRNTIEKSILPTINATVKNSIEQKVVNALAVPLEKTLPKELRSAVSDAMQKALFDNVGGVKFADTISQAVIAKLEATLQKDLSSRLGPMFEKTLTPLITKLDERMQASIKKSMEQIQKENRVSQQETVKKLEDLTDAISHIAECLKYGGASRTKSPVNTTHQGLSRKQTMAEFFKTGKYSSAIETWVDSTDDEQSIMFEVCMEYDPLVLGGVDQLSLMSAANAVSIDLRTHLEARLLWLEKIISLSKREGRYAEYWPRVLGLLDQRLDAAFEDINSRTPKSPLARKIAIIQYYVQNKFTEMTQ